MKAARILPIPPEIELLADGWRRAFQTGCNAAMVGDDSASNPYTAAAQRTAWAAGWLACKESWVEGAEGAWSDDDDDNV